MKGTRLWQNTGSPLISGRSRRVRPMRADVTFAFVAALVLWALAVMAIAWIDGTPSDSMAMALVRSIPGAAIAAFLGAFPAVAVARSWGMRRPWMAGAVVGFVAAVIAGLVTAPFLASL